VKVNKKRLVSKDTPIDVSTYCVVDFNYYLNDNNGIIVKELAVYFHPRVGSYARYVFEAPLNYDLSSPPRVHSFNANVLQVTRVGIPIYSGDIAYSRLAKCVIKETKNVHDIYVYGDKKHRFICDILPEYRRHHVHNIKHWMETILLRKRIVEAGNHTSKTEDIGYTDIFGRQHPGRLKPCAVHRAYSDKCGVVNDFSIAANKTFCRSHLVSDIKLCPVKRSALYCMYIRSEREEGCEYKEW
jgi:hypothetical protein